MFRGRIFNVWLLALVFNCVTLSLSIVENNVDRLEPVVRKSPSIEGSGDQFGFAMVPHLDTDPEELGAMNLTPNDYAAHARIIVGAPHGQAPGNSSRTGLVYTCPVTPGDCTVLTADQPDDPLHQSMFAVDKNFNASNPQYFREEKDRQLLGASMSVSQDKFVVCAPLYTTFKGDVLRYSGKCFMSDRSLRNFTSHDFCANEMIRDNTVICTTAMSSAGDEVSEAFLFGQPLKSVETGDVTAYLNGMYQEDQSFGLSSSYYGERGYQVAFGRIFDPSRSDFIVAERPTQNINGALNIIQPGGPRTCTIPGPVQSNTFESSTDFSATGVAVGFGFSILAARVSNVSGYDSIFVGAPFVLRSQVNPEVGAVFYFRHTGDVNNCFGIFVRESINGFVNFGRFGYALANLGDINKDGYEDIAISAPYESGGTVYIYVSREDGQGLNTASYAQRIVGREIQAISTINGFGTTLNGGVDVDNNKYNDLVVGSFQSQTVVVLRTRPRIGIKTAFQSITTGRINLDDLSKEDCNGHACFSVEACFAFDNGTTDVVRKNIYDIFTGDSVGLKYELALDPDRRLRGFSPRTFFMDNGAEVQSVQFTLRVNKTEQFCQTQTVFISNGIRDRESPFKVVLRPAGNTPQVPPSNGNQTISDLASRPVVLFESPQSATSVLPEKNCGTDEICMSSLSITLLNASFFAGSKQISNFIPNGVEQVVLYVQVNNTGEDAFDTRLTVTVERDLFKIASVSRMDCREVDSPENDTSLLSKECSIGNPIKSGTNTLRIQLVGERFKEYMVNTTTVRLTLNTTSIENITNDDSLAVPIAIEPRADLIVSRLTAVGSPIVFRSIPSETGDPTELENLGPQINVTIVVTTPAVSSIVPNAILDITWPFRDTSAQNYLLYPAMVASSGINCSGINPDGFPKSVRSKRQNSDGSEAVGSLISTSVECNNSNIECVTIRCVLGRFDSRENTKVIRIASYLDYRYFLNKEMKRVRFPITAKVSLSADYFIDNPPNGDTRTGHAEATYIPDSPTAAPAPDVPIWVIIVPIVVVILALAILIFILYLCGFFKRKREWKTDPQAKVEEVDQPDDANGKEKELEASVEDNGDMKKVESSESIPGDVEVEELPEKPTTDV